MNITACMSVYTRGYRLPEELAKKMKPNSDIGLKLMPKVFSSRYVDRNRISMRELGEFSVSLVASKRLLKVVLYGLCHQSGHAVVIVGLKPDEMMSPEEMKLIQDHWIWKRPEGEIFSCGEVLNAGINDLFDVGYYRLLSDISGHGKGGDISGQINEVKRHDSVKSLLKSLNYKADGFYIPTIFGCTSVLECTEIPDDISCESNPYSVLWNSESVSLPISTQDAVLIVNRNAAVLYTTDAKESGYIYALQMAMLNLVRHYNNFLCGELNEAAALIEKKDYKGGALLAKVKSLHEETVYMYDELHNISLWNSADQVKVGGDVRKGEAWKLNEEVAANLGKLEHLTTLTSEVCKVQGRRGRLFISSLLAGVGFVNLIELIPVWQDYVAQALEVWVPVLTFGVLIVVSVAYLMQREE